MPFRVGRTGEFENCGCRNSNGDAVWDYGGGYLVTRVFIAGVLAGDGVGHACVFDEYCCENS